MNRKLIRMGGEPAAEAFSLIEVTIALGIAAFCLVTVFGLLPIGIVSNQTSFEQTMAGNISSAVISDLRSAQPCGAVTSPRFGLPIPAAGDAATVHTIYISSSGSATTVDGAPMVSGSAIYRYRMTVQFFPPQATAPYAATSVRLLVTWPALADPNYAALPVNYAGSYEADTTLDRN
jgi:uncharacterized protein (TIGR02598 family)